MTVPPRLTLLGHWVRLEPLELKHVEPLMAAAASRETYSLTHVPADLPSMHRYVEEALSQAEAGTAVPFATVDLRTGRLVGSTRFGALEYWAWPGAPVLPLPSGPDAVEIGWTWLSASAQRTVVNTEAKWLMLKHAFEVWGVRRVTLKTDARNHRSRSAIERLGAHFDGILRSHFPAPDGGIRDSAMYSILSSEWPRVGTELRAKLPAVNP